MTSQEPLNQEFSKETTEKIIKACPVKVGDLVYWSFSEEQTKNPTDVRLDPSYTFAVDCVLDRERNLSTQWKEYPSKKISIANHKNLRDFLNKIRMADVGSTFYYKGYPSLCVGAYISSHLQARSILSVFYVYELKAFDMVNISVSSESEPIKHYEQNFEPLF